MHSELPWSVRGQRQKFEARGWKIDSHIITDGSRDQNQVAAVFYTDSTDRLHNETFANALLIIQAVNNHATLVAALQLVIAAHDNLLVDLSPDQIKASLYHAINEARDALSSIK